MSELKRRALNRDGTDNIDRSQLRSSLDDVYHRFLAIGWGRFFLATIAIYVSINIIFGSIYYFLGPQGLEGVAAKEGWPFFQECFFFSVQTFSTIGYGRLAPVGALHNIMASAEAFTGMLSIAVMSGLLFARFSRPKAKIKFSDNALITPFRGQPSLVFRMANARLNQISEAKVSVMLLKNMITPEGTNLRTQFDLPLLRDRSLFFAGSWIVSHVIDEKSPLYGMDAQSLRDHDCEIFISLIGYDETYSQQIVARFSYIWDELVWNRQFADMVSRKDGRLFIDLPKISDLKDLPN